MIQSRAKDLEILRIMAITRAIDGRSDSCKNVFLKCLRVN